jgi:hypothetical protein
LILVLKIVQIAEGNAFTLAAEPVGNFIVTFGIEEIRILVAERLEDLREARVMPFLGEGVEDIIDREMYLLGRTDSPRE